MQLVSLLLLPTFVFAQSQGVGFNSVAAALAALRAKPSASVSVQGGWTIIQDSQTQSLWSFTPEGHPAHPAVVKRATVSKDGAIYIQMTALCEATKSACDKLMQEFAELNKSIAASMKKQSASTAQREVAISVIESDQAGHTLKLSSSTVTEVNEAQSELLKKAREMCAPNSAMFGKFTFEKQEPITDGAAKTQFVLVQRIECESQAKAAVPNATGEPTASGARTMRATSDAEIEVLTLNYFGLRDNRKYAEAYALLSESRKGSVSFSDWQRREEKFNSTSGDLVSRKVRKVTWYKDPPSAPKGIYAAADFASEFANVPVYCGYVVWLQSGEDFRLLREEVNMIDATTFKKLSALDVAKAKQQFGCR